MLTHHQAAVETAKTNYAAIRFLQRLWWQDGETPPKELMYLRNDAMRRLIELRVPSNRWE